MYSQLSSPLKNQLKTLDEHLGDKSKKIKKIAAELFETIPKSEIRDKKKRKKIARRMAFLQVKVKKLMSEKYMNIVKAYNQSGETVKLQRMLHDDDHVRVISGISEPSNTPVVVKWYQSKHKNIQFEIDIYNRMKQLGAPVLNYSTKFKIMDDPLLVMEKLENLTAQENEFEMARQIIVQLQYLHTFTVHNDLKPGNIMKKTDGNMITYYLIDFGGCASTRLSYGYKRSCWTPHFCGQTIHAKEQVTTAKNDLIELGYTMKGIQNMRNGIHKKLRYKETGKGEDPNRTGFDGKLLAYMNRCQLINEQMITKKDYDDLLAILHS